MKADSLFSEGWSFDQCPALASIGVGSHGPEASDWVCHEHLWSLHLYRYRGTLETDRGTFPISPGLMSILPPKVPFRRHYKAANSLHVFALFELPPNPSSKTRIPWLVQWGSGFPDMLAWLESAVGLFALHPTRAALRVWDVLLRVQAPQDQLTKTHGLEDEWLVDRFVRMVELNLENPVTIHDLTEAMGCSYTTLNTRVRSRLGCSVKKYIRRRSLERALDLMKYTRRPIKEIAEALGFQSLQAFNQFIHREAGVSPRDLQEGIRKRSLPKSGKIQR